MLNTLDRLTIELGHLLILGDNVLCATSLLQKDVLMRLNLIGHCHDFLLHLIDLLVQLRDVL